MFLFDNCDWEALERGKVSVKDAKALADSFADACWNGTSIPKWALALRSLAARVRLHEEVANLDA
jgi:hypothetical protein